MAVGKVVRIIGPVIDVEFPSESLPRLLNALEVTVDGRRLILEGYPGHRCTTGWRARVALRLR